MLSLEISLVWSMFSAVWYSYPFLWCFGKRVSVRALETTVDVKQIKCLGWVTTSPSSAVCSVSGRGVDILGSSCGSGFCVFEWWMVAKRVIEKHENVEMKLIHVCSCEHSLTCVSRCENLEWLLSVCRLANLIVFSVTRVFLFLWCFQRIVLVI